MNVTFDILLKSLKNKDYKPIYLLVGEEPFFIDQISDYFENNFMDEADRDMNQLVLYANDKEVSGDQIAIIAKEFPFGVPKRLILIKEAKNLKKIEILEKYAENCSDSTVLVICYKYGKIAPAKCKKFEKNGVIFYSDPIKDWDLWKWVAQRSKEYDFSIKDINATLIAESIGNDLSRIDNEFKKLSLLLPKGSDINQDIIEKYIGISKLYNVGELQKAIGDRDENKCNKIVLNMCHNIKENPVVKITTVLYSFFSQMLAYHLSDKSKESLVAIYGERKSYDYYTAPAKKIAFSEIKRILSMLREYDLKAKGVDSSSPDEALLQEIIFKIFH